MINQKPNPEKYRNKYRIRSARLPGYDYSQNGAYFITICAKNKQHLFGEIILSENTHQMKHTALGKIIEERWHAIPEHSPFVDLGESIIMPNHLHGIILIARDDANEEYQQSYNNAFMPQPDNLASIIRGFKAGVTKHAQKRLGINEIWQSRYHDRIIRNEAEYDKIAEYIETNPETWQKDDYY